MDSNSQDSILVDMVIAVHSPDRPIERAVASLIAGGLPTEPGISGRLRISVVCHNTDVAPIRDRVAPEHRGLIRFLHYVDGIQSPAGPFNYGLSEATGNWVGIMGSDDSLEIGAVAAWAGAASADGADVLVAPMAHAGGGSIRTPVVRRTRRVGLDPISDRLAYRSAPLGLMKRSLIRDLGLAFLTSYASGEDQLFSAKLWFSGARITYGRGLPRYLVHDDAVARVSLTGRPIADDMAFATGLVATDWFSGLTAKARESIVTKLVRVHVFGQVALRSAAGSWSADDSAALAEVLEVMLVSAPNALRPLSRADRALVDALVRHEGDCGLMDRLSSSRRDFSSPATWFPLEIAAVFHPEAPMRFMVASALVR